MALFKDTQGKKERDRLLQARCKTDLELFSILFFPHYCTSAFSQFHLDLFKEMGNEERGTRRARAAPRGNAKSTFVSLIKPIHDVAYGLERFIVIISNTADLANQKLKDIRDEILSNDYLVESFNLRFPSKKPGESEFLLISDAGETLFKAFGRGAQVRGVRHREARPSKIICDDVEHSDEVYNEAIRKKTLTWFREDVSKIGNERTNIEFVGTVLHRDSLLQNLMNNPKYEATKYRSVISWSERQDLWTQWERIYMDLSNGSRREAAKAFFDSNQDAMLKGTKVLWPEKEPYYYLMEEMIEIGRRSFFKEKQNEPLGADERVFEKIWWYREETAGARIEETNELIPWEILKQRAYGTMDPSAGQVKAKKGKLGDWTCILTGFAHPNGRIFVHHDWTKRKPPTEYIRTVFELHEEFKYQKFGVETNLYRNLLLPNMIEERKRREKEKKTLIQLPFYEIDQTENKEKRITALEPKVTHAWMIMNRSLSETFRQQLEEFPHADHDDCCDALDMLYGVVHNRYKAAPESVDAIMGR